MVDENLQLLTVRRICEIMMTLDLIFWLVHCSSEDVQHYLSECVGRHQAVLLINVVQENPTRNTV